MNLDWLTQDSNLIAARSQGDGLSIGATGGYNLAPRVLNFKIRQE